MMEYMNILDVPIGAVKLRELKQGEDDRGTDSSYYRYYCDHAVVDIESTAPSMMEEMTSLPVHMQIPIVKVILALVPNPGDQVIISGDRKKRGARAVRLAPTKEGHIALLVTH
jgi:hypothetical protein